MELQRDVSPTWHTPHRMQRRGDAEGSGKSRQGRRPAMRQIPVDRIRPEEGLARKRDRVGHRELCDSIAQFGVLTPITVRKAPDGSGDYLLIKGQGRTLACHILGIAKIPAVVVDDHFAEAEKVQQFLVENVARLRMRPVDRALLIAHARNAGEEASSVARRFGVSASTVRRLESQLDGASSSEVTALRRGDLNLALHAVITRYVDREERSHAIRVLTAGNVSARDAAVLFSALGWETLVSLGPQNRSKRFALLNWACKTWQNLPRGGTAARLTLLAERLPMDMSDEALRLRAAR